MSKKFIKTKTYKQKRKELKQDAKILQKKALRYCTLTGIDDLNSNLSRLSLLRLKLEGELNRLKEESDEISATDALFDQELYQYGVDLIDKISAEYKEMLNIVITYTAKHDIDLCGDCFAIPSVFMDGDDDDLFLDGADIEGADELRVDDLFGTNYDDNNEDVELAFDNLADEDF